MNIIKKLITKIISPFRYELIIMSRVVYVASRDSSPEDKLKAHYVCDGLSPDDFTINTAIKQLGYLDGKYDWEEVKRRMCWCLPWQRKPSVRIKKFREGGRLSLQGNYCMQKTIVL